MENPHEKPGNWAYRRRFMYVVSLFCMAVIAYVLWTGQETSPADTAVTMSYVTLMAIVGSYVFGCTWGEVKQLASLK